MKKELTKKEIDGWVEFILIGKFKAPIFGEEIIDINEGAFERELAYFDQMVNEEESMKEGSMKEGFNSPIEPISEDTAANLAIITWEIQQQAKKFVEFLNSTESKSNDKTKPPYSHEQDG